MGETFFDTSELYGIYANEDLVGEALEPVRDQVVLATKFGWDIREGRCVGLDSPETIRRAVEGSLRRLRTDHIDLYYQHRVDPKVPIELVAETMQELIREGKILHWGSPSPGWRPCAGPQGVPGDGGAERVLPLVPASRSGSCCPPWRSWGIGFVPLQPLGKGFLTGTVAKDQTFGAGGTSGAPSPGSTTGTTWSAIRPWPKRCGYSPAAAGSPRPGLPGLAAAPEALDRPHSGHQDRGAAAGEYERRLCGAVRGGLAGI